MSLIFELLKYLKKMEKIKYEGDLEFNFEGTVRKNEINIRIFKKEDES